MALLIFFVCFFVNFITKIIVYKKFFSPLQNNKKKYDSNQQ